MKSAFEKFIKEGDDIKNNEVNRKNRFSSWDECYDYFEKDVLKTEKPDFKKAGLYLGFYLASWGMFRGSSRLLECGIKNFEEWAEQLKKIYSETSQLKEKNKFTRRYNSIKELFSEDKGRSKANVSPTQTLITKIMLGVYGDFPAIDTYFNEALKKTPGCTGIYSRDVAEKIWEKIDKVYELKIEGCGNLRSVIGDLRNELPDQLKDKFFDAKILDALFFTIGRRLNKKD